MIVIIVFSIKEYGEGGGFPLFLEQLENILLRTIAFRCNLILTGGGFFYQIFLLFSFITDKMCVYLLVIFWITFLLTTWCPALNMTVEKRPKCRH